MKFRVKMKEVYDRQYMVTGLPSGLHKEKEEDRNGHFEFGT